MTTPKSATRETQKAIDEMSDEEFKRWLENPQTSPDEEAAIDAWEERNRDALNESIRQGRENYAKGNYSSLEDAMARIRAGLNDDKN